MFWAKSTLLQTFCFEVARLQVYVAITCYMLLHQTTRIEWKNTFRQRGDILVSEHDPQRFFFIFNTLILIYGVLSSFRLCYIQFKEIEISWKPRTAYEGRGRIKIRFWKLKIYFAEMFYESLKKKLSWNFMLRYTIKLLLN